MTTGSALGTVFVLGGARSGKSAFAESLLEAGDRRKIYVATAQIRDSEMESRIDRHRRHRGPDWTTLEEPLDLVGTLARETGQGRAFLIDCLTLWVTNLMMSDRDVDGECERLVAFVDERANSSGDAFVFVSNEVGLGIVPDNAMARAFRDHAGLLHAKLAAVVSEVYFVTAGLPLKIKG